MFASATIEGRFGTVALLTRTFADGFVFTEGPRWHDDELWCSDMHGHRVVAVSQDGTVRTIVEVPDDDPSGLGWLPDGRLLIVAMEQQQVLRLEPSGELSVHADLSAEAIGSLNDMIVASDGTAYVGDMGVYIQTGGERRPGQLFVVRPDGSHEVADKDLASPNGMALTPSEDRLLVAQSGGRSITEFDRDSDGLTGRREFAPLISLDPALPAGVPDGICLDEEEAVWYADPIGHRVSRVRRGGAVTDSIDFGEEVPVACVLGGPDRSTLYICAAPGWRRDELAGTSAGRIAAVPVRVAGMGKP
jgi:sugar lactone lactonase YvrE